MNLFEINFLGKMSALLKEAFKFKKYKAMNPALAVFTGLLMLPIVVASFAVTAMLAAVCFAFNVLSSPVKFLHGIVTAEGKDVKHATQFIIYFISWPLVFFTYAIMSFLLLLIIPTYALLSFLTYVWSLGGFKFHLFVTNADDISIEVDGRYSVLPWVYIFVGLAILVIAPVIHGTVHFVDLWNNFLEATFFGTFFGGIYGNYMSAHVVFSILYSLIGFARFPKAKAAAPAVEEKAEEYQSF